MPRPALSPGARAALALSLAAAALSVPARAQDAAVSDVMKVPRPAGGEYFGLYILGKKVGYQFIQVGYVPGGKDKVRMVDNVVMRANVGGRNVERLMSETRVYESKPGGKRQQRRGARHPQAPGAPQRDPQPQAVPRVSGGRGPGAGGAAAQGHGQGHRDRLHRPAAVPGHHHRAAGAGDRARRGEDDAA